MAVDAARRQAALDGLDPEQRAAVSSTAHRLLVVAGAGSGKTRVFVHRIARLVADGADPASILALSYTKAAADEVSERLAAMGVQGVQAMTLHAWCHREPLRRYAHLIGKEGYRIMDADASVDVLRYEMRLGEHGANAAKAVLTAAKNSVDFEAEELRRAELVKAYDEILASRHRLDFDDLQVKTFELLAEHPEVLEHYRSSLAHVLIDEYQDINQVQHEILALLCEDAGPGKPLTLTVVGDPDQAIYGFRGADDRYIKGFLDDHPRATRVVLGRNYRSTRQVLEAAEAVIEGNVDRLHKKMVAAGPEPDGVEPWAQMCSSEDDEALMVAQTCAELIEAGTAPEQVAVLYRYHKQAGPLEAALREAGIAYRRYGGDGEELPDEQEAPQGRAGYVPRLPPGVTIAGMPTAGLSTASVGDREEEAGRVVLRTVHSAKGLEYDAVVLPGWSEGAVPSYRAEDGSEEMAEERRVAYVAITRARETCVITWPATRLVRGGRRMRTSPSRFIAEIEARQALGSTSLAKEN